MKKAVKILILLTVLALFITGCANLSQPAINPNVDTDTVNEADKNEEDTNKVEDSDKDAVTSPSEDIDESDKEDEKDDTKNELDYSLVKPNESGKVMVIMYHALADKERDWVRSYDNFKEDLQLLYDRGYRAVSLTDYVNNTMNVEAGKTPVVFTFDDGNKSDFDIINEDKELNPNCAVAILEDFAKTHPDFGLEATFFVNGNPFRQKEYAKYKMKYVIEKGMDIGNHTLQHEKLGSQSKEDIEMSIAKNVELINKVLPGYPVNTLALPHGSRPKTDDVARTNALYHGSYDGIEYENITALAVGWDPNASPVAKKFDARFVHRVQGSNVKFGLRYWMDYLEENPSSRYISDGILDVVTVPKKRANIVDKDKLNGKELKIYNITEDGSVTVE